MKPTDITRFWKKVEKTEMCWNWTAGTQKGYGAFHLNGRMQPAHRVIYRHIYGAIKDGLEIDHTCFNRQCVNPMHLDPVTPSVNTRRGILNSGQVKLTYQPIRKEYCRNGHLRTTGNTYEYLGGRSCRVCQLAVVHRYNIRKARVAI